MGDLLDYALDILQDLLEAPERILEWIVSLIVPNSFLIALIVIGALFQSAGLELLGLIFTKTSTFVSDVVTKIGLLLLIPAVVVYVTLKFVQPFYSILSDFF